jgi:cytochrome c551/c552
MNKSALANWLKITVLAAILASGQALAADGFKLAQDNGCFVCHQPTDKRTGPSFSDIAKKYAGKKGAAARISTHIVKGTGPDGMGWQAEDKAMLPFMPPNAAVTPKNGLTLAKWVLAEAGKATDKAKFATDKVSVTGQVRQPLELNIDNLQKLPVLQMKMIPHGVRSNEKPAPVIVRGVLIRDILEKAVIQTASPYDVKKSAILVTASDGYRVIFSWAEVFHSPIGEGAMLFFEKDGKPLGDDEGKIALASLRDNNNIRYTKWVKSIEVRTIAD